MAKLKIVLLISLIIGALLMIGVGLFPALAQEPQPAGSAPGAQSLANVETLTMPPLDRPKLLREDEQRALSGLPPRFAQPIPVRVSPRTHGTWEDISNNRRMWRLRIISQDALSLNFGFTHYAMPPGGQLFLYTPDRQTIRGPFTDQDNESHGQLWTPLLPGGNVIIEVTLPEDAVSQLALELTSVNHGYVEFGSPPPVKSGACNLDVVCSVTDGFPQVDSWREEIRSVGVYSLGGSTFCTGVLVNNTAQDLKPYFLTADHCNVNTSQAPSLVVYWNYENSTCRAPGSPASGGAGDGQLNQFQTGAFFRADYSPSDMTLLELDDPPNSAFNVHWAGWDRTGANASVAVGIHHPNTDEKRISFENNPTSITSYLGGAVPGDNTHVRVTDWDLGTTEGGSSGSPLFNQDQRIIGQLHGGGAACGNDLSDWYGRFSVSWTGGGNNATRLSNWLDPGNTGLTVLDGQDQRPDFTLAVTPATHAICAPANAVYTLTVGSVLAFDDPITLNATGQPAGTTANFSVNPLAPPGSSVLTLGNTGAATPGSYNIQLTGIAPTRTHNANVQLDLYNSLPGLFSLSSPANGATNIDLQPSLSWVAASQAARYQIEIAADPGFSNIIYTAVVTGTSHAVAALLSSNTTYYWRVQPDNICGAGGFSATFSFKTLALPGDCSPNTSPNILLSESFEAGPAGWAQGSGGSGNTWALWGTQVHSGAQAWHADTPAAVSDQRLVSPPVVLPTDQSPLMLQFWNYQDIERNNEGGCFDGGILEISSDGGGNWTQLPNSSLSTDPYDGLVDPGFQNPLGGLEAWCGNPQDWLASRVDLNAYAGQTVNFRFRLGTDVVVGREGWTIDDVVVQSCLAPADLTFFPVIMQHGLTAPDLMVADLVAANNAVTVVIKNIGNGPSIDAFWVDVYFKPDPAPTAVNQTWPQLAGQGLVWGVTQAIPANETLTLTIGDAFYSTQYSHFSGTLPPGTPVWAQVDSVNLNTTYGGVLESHEIDGDSYNNIIGPVLAAGAAETTDAPAVKDLSPAANDQLPPRE